MPALSISQSHAYIDRMVGNLAYSPIEQEIIVLRAVWDMIDGMVNYENFEKGHGTVEAQVMFMSAISAESSVNPTFTLGSGS